MPINEVAAMLYNINTKLNEQLTECMNHESSNNIESSDEEISAVWFSGRKSVLNMVITLIGQVLKQLDSPATQLDSETTNRYLNKILTITKKDTDAANGIVESIVDLTTYGPPPTKSLESDIHGVWRLLIEVMLATARSQGYNQGYQDGIEKRS
jgi:hypothetical protein